MLNILPRRPKHLLPNKISQFNLRKGINSRMLIGLEIWTETQTLTLTHPKIISKALKLRQLLSQRHQISWFSSHLSFILCLRLQSIKYQLSHLLCHHLFYLHSKSWMPDHKCLTLQNNCSLLTIKTNMCLCEIRKILRKKRTRTRSTHTNRGSHP